MFVLVNILDVFAFHIWLLEASEFYRRVLKK